MKTHWVRIGGLVILLGAFVLRAWRLDFQELRGDEAFGYFFSLRPYCEIIHATFALQEPHPVAGYFVQKAWLDRAGHSEFALRFVSLWFGVLAVALVIRIGRRLELPPSSSLLAGTLMALSPYAIWHSQDARMYSMSLALTLGSTWLAVEWLQRRRAQGALAWAGAYLAVSWLALHTHYFNVFVLLAQSLFVLTRELLGQRWLKTWAAWGALQTILALLYLPWLLPALPTLTGYSGNGDSPGFGALVWRSLSVFGVGESVPTGQRIGWAAVGLFLLLLGVIQLWLRGPGARQGLWLLGFYLCIPLLATWYSAQQRPIFNERYLIAAAPPFYLLLASAFLIVRRTFRTIVPSPHLPISQSLNLPTSFLAWPLILILLAGMTLSLHRHYADPAYSKTRGWRELATRMEQLTAPIPPEQVRLAQNFPDPTLWYYYRGSVAHVVIPPAPHDRLGAAEEVTRLAAAGVQRVILPVQPAPNWDEVGIASAALAERYSLAATEQVGVWPVELYSLPPPALTLQEVEFQNGVQLGGYALQPQGLAAGDYLVVYLSWTGDPARLNGTEKVFVQLLNAAGELVAQDDRPLTLAQTDAVLADLALYAILLPETLPVGEYHLITGIYDPAQERAPRVPTAAGLDFVWLTNIAPGDRR